MDHRDHVRLLRDAVVPGGLAGGRWADLGSGKGAFTLALADLLGPGAGIVSVDRDRGALDSQRREMQQRFPAAKVEYRVADFTDDLGLTELEGILMANSLHFVRDKETVLGPLVASLRPGGRLVLVEYDSDSGNTWVPYPISSRSWPVLAARCGLEDTKLLHTIPSRFLGRMYSALSHRRGGREIECQFDRV